MKKNILSTLIIASLFAGSSAHATDENPVTKALQVPGAQVTLPVSAAQETFSKQFIDGAHDSFNSFHAQMGGDHTLYYLTNFAAMLRTDHVSPAPEYVPLKKNLNSNLGDIRHTTESEGELSFDEYVVHPTFRHQGVMMLHKGEVVYEAYPGMKASDAHWLASSGKAISGLTASILVEQGKLDTSKAVTHYVKDFVGTNWDDVTVLDLINHTSGLDIEETTAALLNPESIFVRFAYSSIGVTDRSEEIENWIEVLAEAEFIEGEKPGDRFRYSSLNTQVLGMVFESTTGYRWSDIVEENVWGKMNARMPLYAHLTPDGTALSMGILSATLEDMARFGTLFTPSWPAVATEQVVTPAILDRIRSAGNPEAFQGSMKEKQAMAIFDEKPVKGAYQFDFFFEDGAMYKHGNMGQGIYIDPARDFVAVYFSTTPYVAPYGEIKMPAYFRKAAAQLAGQ